MIKYTKNQEPPSVKAVGLLSGGLDSTLACRIIREMGVEVHAVYFSMPWGCCNKVKAQEAADRIGVRLIVLQLDERYLETVKNPRFGYGKGLNPCVDCRIHMFSRAAHYMKSIGADFAFTGEVLGQRPMSQLRHSMRAIEKNSGLEGRLLRPLCAKLLEPTIPETEGKIDREKMLELSGRSRKDQIHLAERLDIKDYPNPAGGCLLTDKNFARRMQDTLNHGYRNFRETIALKWGRHFRITEDYKVILGRDESENESLKSYAHQDDVVMELPNKLGPSLILKGHRPSDKVLSMAAGLIQRYSRYHADGPIEVECWPVTDRNHVRRITSILLDETQINEMKI